MERTRIEIWEALSEFYLDTELTKEDFERISYVFVKSDLRLSEIKKIDLFEVFPLLQTNLLSVAGVWDRFDQPWLIENCTKNYLKRNKRLHKLNCKLCNLLFYWMRKDYWVEIEKLISA